MKVVAKVLVIAGRQYIFPNVRVICGITEPTRRWQCRLWSCMFTLIKEGPSGADEKRKLGRFYYGS